MLFPTPLLFGVESFRYRAMVKKIEELTEKGRKTSSRRRKMERFCTEFGTRPTPCRWTTGEKNGRLTSPHGCEKTARGAATARAQGISSPTPSVESLRVLLGMACGAWGCSPMGLFAIDVSQAFMNAPLEKRHVVVRLPISVSGTMTPMNLRPRKA